MFRFVVRRSPIRYTHTSSTLADYNECEVDNGGCNQTCVNLPFGRECHCNTSYSLDSDGTGCVANSVCSGEGAQFSCQCLAGFRDEEGDGRNCVGMCVCSTPLLVCVRFRNYVLSVVKRQVGSLHELRLRFVCVYLTVLVCVLEKLYLYVCI